jgi:response regulator RpfG family c-di-GMP phosphodiesterase
MSEEKLKILCVDDEPMVLEGLSRQLRKNFSVTTATGGEAGLEIMEREGAFVTVVSDMRMPGMNGAEFLKNVLQRWPDTVRILLTGQTELDAAITAVNEGNIFRFLTKPCPPDKLISALNAAVAQYKLITSERVLLEQTLHGCIKTLTDILAMANPEAFGRAKRAKSVAGGLAEHFKLSIKWPIEVAAMLSPIGCITLPSQTAEKLYHGTALTEEERVMVAKLPSVANQLIAPIPRLEPVRDILSSVPLRFDGVNNPAGMAKGKDILLGARILKIVLDADELDSGGRTIAQIFNVMRGRTGAYDPDVLNAFIAYRGLVDSKVVARSLKLHELRCGMIFMEDVTALNGMLLVTRGQEVGESLLERLRNFSGSRGIKEPILVSVHNAPDPT